MKVVYVCVFVALFVALFLAFNDPLPKQEREVENFQPQYPRNTIACEGDADTRAIDALDDEWTLVWHDEFNGSCLDALKWQTEDWAAEKNNELQYYTPHNFMHRNGLLSIVSKKEAYKGRSYTSGAIHSKGKFSFLYGKAEIRAKLPKGQGIFPAFWMMPDKDNTWLPEIDILEMLGHKPNEIWMVSHWQNEQHTLSSDAETFTGPDFSQDFHVFSVEWTPTAITWLIDGVERFHSTAYVPQEPMYVYVNTAIGGNWPGSPDDTTAFPVQFDIDYIRVYERTP